MKKLFSLTRLLVLFVIVWLIAKYGFGINIPLLRKNSPTQSILNQRIQLLPGFTISVFADQVPGVRSILETETGDLLASLSKKGKVVLLHKDADLDGLSDGQQDLITGLNLPHGMDIYQGWLYIAETDAIGRIQYDAKSRQTVGEYQRIVTGLPKGGNHWSRSLRFGPDGLMYVSIGSSCNSCQEKDARRAAILRFTADGKQQEFFATGLRNTVGFDWHPETKDLYGVDNGRDFLGDDFPPDELNKIESGRFYGWPYFNGDQIPDDDFTGLAKQKLAESRPPVHQFASHSAPLSIVFIENEQLRKLISGDALVALHGSWNRTEMSGYKLVVLKFGPDRGILESDFITGFEFNDDVIGRPVAIVESSEGELYISDDFSGSIYRVSHTQSP